MKVLPNYSRYEPGGGFRPVPESDVICMICGYEIGTRAEIDFCENGVCHAECLRKESEDVDDGK